MTGKIHSIQTLGATDGPGVRFTVFTQGCNLRCACCHNPDTWDMTGGTEVEPCELAEKATHYKEYFGDIGGVTVSGGETLLQTEFVTAFFKKCKKFGINTCLDTSGCILNEKVKELLRVTDLVMLDIKYTSEEKYRNLVGCSLSAPLRFLEHLESLKKPTWIRQVIIPGLNDSAEDVLQLKALTSNFKCVEKIELLPFKKLCQVKYDNLKLEFPLKSTPEPTLEKMEQLNYILTK